MNIDFNHFSNKKVLIFAAGTGIIPFLDFVSTNNKTT
jgi:hypothetical protein